MAQTRWRLAFLLGGTEGIGAAVAAQLAAEGTHVVVFSRSPEKVDRAVRSLPGARGHTVDLTDADRTRTVLHAAVHEHGVPDLVVITAGYARAGWFGDLPLGTVQELVTTNLMGTVHACAALLPQLRAAGTGTIVTTSSLAGMTGVPGYTGYSASKFAVLGFSEALRREVARDGVRVVTLCPPNTRTPGFAEENRTKPPEVLAAEEKVPTLDPDQVATALLHGLRGRARVVVPGRQGRLSALAVRLAPGLAERQLRLR